MLLEICIKYLLNASVICSGLDYAILFSITEEDTEFEILFREISSLLVIKDLRN